MVGPKVLRGTEHKLAGAVTVLGLQDVEHSQIPMKLIGDEGTLHFTRLGPLSVANYKLVSLLSCLMYSRMVIIGTDREDFTQSLLRQNL